MDGNLAMAVTGGSISVAGIVTALVVWSLKRNVQHEDDGRKADREKMATLEKDLQAANARHEKDLQDLRTSISDVKHQNELDARDVAQKVSTLTSTVGELRGLIQNLSSNVENSREKMSAFYKAELEKTEQVFRQELSRVVHPDLHDRVVKLETAASAKPLAKKRR